MKFLGFCYENKGVLHFILALIGCGMILVDWKICHHYPDHHQWIISYITLAVIGFVHSIKNHEITIDDDEPFLKK